MQDIKRLVDSGQVELARIGKHNQPVKINYADLQDTRDCHERRGRTYESIMDLSWAERYDWVDQQRTKGNELYKQAQYHQALETYLDSLIGIDLKDKSEDRLERVTTELKYPILLNMASCFYRLAQFDKGLEICGKILEEHHGRSHLTAMFKQAWFLYELSRYDEAKKVVGCLSRLSQQSPDHSKVTVHDINDLRAKINQKLESEKALYRKFFTEKEDCEEPEQQALRQQPNELPKQASRLAVWCRQFMQAMKCALKGQKNQRWSE